MAPVGAGSSPRAARAGSRRRHLLTGAGLVSVGGTLGTAGRYAVEQLLPAGDGVPLGTLVVNLAGAFLLGLLLEGLARSGEETPPRRRWRLLAGTGVLGGFTTYSTFAVETTTLARVGDPLALGYVVLSLVGGMLAVGAGAWCAAGRRPVSRTDVPVDPDTDQPPSGAPRGPVAS